MEQDEKISVIIPIYNRENNIKKCIDSVLAQKKVNLEIILIDDGSSDDSGIIAEMYADSNDSIVAVHQSNMGISAARNKGLDICKGDYVFFLDSDDYIAEDALFKLYEAIKLSGADISTGVYERLFENGALEYQHHIPEYYRNRRLSKEDLLSLMYIENSYLWCVAWGKLYKRSVFFNIRYPVGLTSEDEYVMPQILDVISSVYLLDDVLYYQILTKNSIIRSKLSIKTLNASKAILVMMDYLINNKYYDMALFRFGKGTRFLLEWKKETDDTRVQSAIKEQYKSYCKIAKTLMPHVNIKSKIRLWLFGLNINLYGRVRDLVKIFDK